MNTKQITLTEKRFFEYHLDDTSVTLRNQSGSYGGGSEVLVIQPIMTQLDRSVQMITKESMSNMLDKER